MNIRGICKNTAVMLMIAILVAACSAAAADGLQSSLQGEWECDAGMIVFTAEKMNVNDQADVDYQVIDGRHIRLVGSEAADEYIDIEVMISGDRMTLINQTRISAAPENCIRKK